MAQLYSSPPKMRIAHASRPARAKPTWPRARGALTASRGSFVPLFSGAGRPISARRPTFERQESKRTTARCTPRPRAGVSLPSYHARCFASERSAPPSWHHPSFRHVPTSPRFLQNRKNRSGIYSINHAPKSCLTPRLDRDRTIESSTLKLCPDRAVYRRRRCLPVHCGGLRRRASNKTPLLCPIFPTGRRKHRGIL